MYTTNTNKGFLQHKITKYLLARVWDSQETRHQQFPLHLEETNKVFKKQIHISKGYGHLSAAEELTSMYDIGKEWETPNTQREGCEVQ